MMRVRYTASALIVAAALTATPASAGQRNAYDGQGYVTAESQVGNGTVSGPVRMGRFGREVRLPGGTWEPCRRSCSETLRVSTIDFWYAHGPSAIATECGIFGCLTIGHPR